MLIIQNDPAGITGRQRIEWDKRLTIQANVEQHLTAGGDCEVWINGFRANPVSDPRMDRPPTDEDTVVISRRPAGGVWRFVTSIAAGLIAGLMPKVQAPAVGKDSPNNSLTGQSNVARAYQAIPDVYGFRRVWPDLIQPSSVEYIDHIKYVTEWLCISRGRGTISSIQYAETPIADIAGSSYEVFQPVDVDGYPELGNVTLNDVIETFASDEVNGQELTPASSKKLIETQGTVAITAGLRNFVINLVDSSLLDDFKALAPSGTARVAFYYADPPRRFDEDCTVLSFTVSGSNCAFTLRAPANFSDDNIWSLIDFTIQPSGGGLLTDVGPFTLPVQCDRIRWNTVFLRGLKGTVQVRATWWQIDTGGAIVAGTTQSQDFTYTADTLDQRFYTDNVIPAAGLGRYRIKFARLTRDLGGQGADVAKLEEVYAVRRYATKVLPGVTVIRLTTKATTDATGFSDRKFNLRWQRHVRPLGAGALAPSRNFARAMAHIWTLAGNDMSGLDVAALSAINAEFGEASPLLRFDGSLDDADASLGDRLQLVANMARCVVWRDGIRWTVTRDQARDFPELQLDYRNLAKSGESTISYAAHLPASNDGVEVEYVDEATQSKKAYVRLSIATGAPVVGTPRNPRKVKMPGCATYAQANNRAQLEVRRLLYQRTTVQDTALADGTLLGLGSLVRWVDPNDFGGDGLQAGEVMSITGSVITTSEPLNWQGLEEGRILLTGADGSQLGRAVRCYREGDAVRLASVPAGLYVADGARQLGSRYAFAVGLTQAETEAAGLFTVTEIRPGADGSVSLGLASYDARIYEAD